jgi:hypothetical protein
VKHIQQHISYSSSSFLALTIITNMNVLKSSTIFLLLMILLSVMQGSTSRYLVDHVDMEKRSERKLISSMFIQSYSAILSSLNTRKSKFNQIHAVSRHVVPSGPNPLHN